MTSFVCHVYANLSSHQCDFNAHQNDYTSGELFASISASRRPTFISKKLQICYVQFCGANVIHSIYLNIQQLTRSITALWILTPLVVVFCLNFLFLSRSLHLVSNMQQNYFMQTEFAMQKKLSRGKSFCFYCRMHPFHSDDRRYCVCVCCVFYVYLNKTNTKCAHNALLKEYSMKME